MTIERINDQYGFDTAHENVAICESRASEKILRFVELHRFDDNFIHMHQNGYIWRVYYIDSKLVAEDKNGDVFKIEITE